MKKIIYTYWNKSKVENKTFEGENATEQQCLFAYQLAFPNNPKVREIQLWTGDEKTLTIRP